MTEKRRQNLIRTLRTYLVLNLMLIGVLLISIDNVAAQQKTISGSVISTIDKEPIIGATIVVANTANGTSTDIDGKFTLNGVPDAGLIVVSYLGYETVELPIQFSKPYSIVLKESTLSVNEVVVVGGGVQKKESVIGAISTIEPLELKLPTANLSSSLVGSVPGIIGVQNSGEPGSSASFYIRGIATLNSALAHPLILVDGVERSLDLVDVEDIESFSVLKDASATAVYGVRGANGVIIIETKRGAKGKPRIDVQAEAGILTPIKMPELVNSYNMAELYNSQVKPGHFSDTAMEQYKMDPNDPRRDHMLYPDVNWIDEIFKDHATNYRASASVSGGGDIARYYISGSLYNESSIFKNSPDYDSSINYNKVSFRANIDVNLFPTTELNFNMANVFTTKNEPGNSTGDIWYTAFTMSPNTMPVYYTDNNGDFLAWSGQNVGQTNPYNMLVNSGYKESFNNTTQTNIGLTQKFNAVKGLSARVNFSWDAQNNNTQRRTKSVQQFVATGRDSNGDLILEEAKSGDNTLGYGISRSGNRSTNLNATINYDRQFKDSHNVTAMAMYYHRVYNDLVGGGGDANYRSLPYKEQGLAARATYNYKYRYFIEANLGYNGSENFAPKHRFGLFPAVAGGWMISNEKFMAPVKRWLSLLKIKGSYGIVGNDKIGGSRRFIYKSTIWQDAPGYGGFGETGGYNSGGIAIGELENLDVTWEQAAKYNVGFELGLMDNKFRLNADFFGERRTGIFGESWLVPYTSGMNDDFRLWTNQGEVTNRGFDAEISWDQQFGDFRLTAKGNFTFARNKVIENISVDWAYPWLNREGQVNGQTWGLISDGYFVSAEDIAMSPEQTFGEVQPGDIKYRDINGDGIIDQYDQMPIGYPSMPEITYGFGATAEWKGLQLSLLFQGTGNSTVFLEGAALNPFSTGVLNEAGFYQHVYDNIWRDPSDVDAEFPRVTAGTNSNNTQTSTHWMRNNSYFRLKNAEIAYNLPKKIVNKINLSNIRIYVQGVNLFTVSKFDLWDPENGGGQGMNYPINRIYNIGLQITY